jgi:hypothetical protein
MLNYSFRLYIVDLRQYCSAIEDQGQLGSCTGMPFAGANRIIR